MFTSLHDGYTKWGYVFPPSPCWYWLTAKGAVCAASTLRTRDAGLCFTASLCKDTDVTYPLSDRQWLFRIGLHLPCLEVDPLIDIMDIIDKKSETDWEWRERERKRVRKNDEAFSGSYETRAAITTHDFFVVDKRLAWFVTRCTNRKPTCGTQRALKFWNSF